jgi:parallel beta-helix repeat protein
MQPGSVPSPAIALALAIATLIANPAAAATLTVDDTGAGDYISIQAAVNAAASGDTILIKPHSDPKGWRENVVITTPDLTLRGDTVAARANLNSQICPTVYLDGCETPANITGCGATVVSVEGTGVSLQRFHVRHGAVEFTAAGGSSALRESCVAGMTSDAVRTANPGPNAVTIHGNVFWGGSSLSLVMYGNDHVITNNRLFNIDDGMDLAGDGYTVTGNIMRGTNDGALEYDGNDTLIANNTLIGVYGDGAIDTSGDRITIRGNLVDHLVSGDCIKSDGADVVITRNSVSNCNYDGISHTGPNATITSNRLTNFGGEGLEVDADGGGGIISGNRIENAFDDDVILYVRDADGLLIENNDFRLSDEAIELASSFTNGTFRGNRISRMGAEGAGEFCVQISATNNTFENNQLELCTMGGFWVADGANDNTFRGNTIGESGLAGIRVNSASGTVVDGNSISTIHGEGVANVAGTSMVITDNTITGNRTDVCNNGTVATFSGNTFDTGGTSTPCVVNQ